VISNDVIVELEVISQSHVSVRHLLILKVVEPHCDKERTLRVRRIVEDSILGVVG